MAAAVLPVDGPGNRLFAGKFQLGGVKGEQGAPLLHRPGAEQRLEARSDLPDAHGLAHQNHLKQAVVQLHPVGGQISHSGYRVGVAHHAVEEVVLQHLPVVLHLHVVGSDGRDGGNPRHDIGQMAESLFQILRGIIGHLGKGPEGGHIDKGLLVQGADVPAQGLLVPRRQLRRLLIAPGDAQGGAAVVGGAGGDIAQQGRTAQFQQAGRRLAEGPVPAAAHHPVIVGPQLPGHPGGVLLVLGGVDGGEPPGFGKLIHHAGQMGGRRSFPGRRVIDKQHALHIVILPVSSCPAVPVRPTHNFIAPYYTALPGKCKVIV